MAIVFLYFIKEEYDMAYVQGEKKNLLTPVAKGPDVEHLKFRTTFNGEDCHYPDEMISGCKMIEKCIDCCTELSNTRSYSYAGCSGNHSLGNQARVKIQIIRV